MKINLCAYTVWVDTTIYTGYRFYGQRYITIPEEFTPVKLGIPKKGDYYAVDYEEVSQCHDNSYSHIVLILKRKRK